jgi:hypothetical protein
MKMNLKAKDFADKTNLEKSLSTLLKKPLMAVLKKDVEKLPFCYEVDYFGEGRGFMSIGVAKEVNKMFKTKRSKGQDGADKKKVAFGHVSINDDGEFEFCVVGGKMKETDAKKVIKSIAILKKNIGDNFIITSGEAKVKNEAAAEVEEEVEEEEVEEEVKGAKELANDYKIMLAEYKEVQKAEHDTKLVKQLYKELLSWELSFQELDAETQAKLDKFQKSYAGTLESVKKIMIADKKIGIQVDKVAETIMNYINVEDHDSDEAKNLYTEASKGLDTLIKYGAFVKSSTLLAQCRQLKELLDS